MIDTTLYGEKYGINAIHNFSIKINSLLHASYEYVSEWIN